MHKFQKFLKHLLLLDLLRPRALQQLLPSIEWQGVVSSAPLVFDMRGGGLDMVDELRVINYYIGDDEGCNGGKVHAVIEELDPDVVENGAPMTTIILDSGADAPVFPDDWLHHGSRVREAEGKRLQDAQGNTIPTLGKRDIDIYFTDVSGRQVCLRERVTISNRVSQPILCFGKLLESGWSINSKSQTLIHEDSNSQIPIDMQNRSLVVQGHIRMVQEDPLEIRLMKATTDASLLGYEHGWHMNDKGHVIGFHISNKFIDPLDYNQQFYDMYRTTLCQDGDGQWQLVEICEKIDALVYLDNEFETPGMRNVLTILTESFTNPEDMRFSLEGELDLKGLRAAAAHRKQWPWSRLINVMVLRLPQMT